MTGQTDSTGAGPVESDPAEVTNPALQERQTRLGNKRSLEDASLEEEEGVADETSQASATGALPPSKRARQQPEGETETHVSGSPVPLQDPEEAPQGSSQEDSIREPEQDSGLEAVFQQVQDEVQSAPEEQVEEIPAPAPLDWNSGTHKGIRTSFGKATTTISASKTRQRTLVIPAGNRRESAKSDSSQNNTPQATEDSAESGGSDSDEPAKPAAPVTKAKTKENLVKLKNSTWIQPSINPLTMGSRKADYLNYCRMFCAANSASPNFSTVKPHLVLRAYKAFLDGPLVPAAVRTQARRTAKNIDGNEVAPIIAKALGTAAPLAENTLGENVSGEKSADADSTAASPPAAGAADVAPATEGDEPPLNGTGKVYMSREEELRQLHLYFPGASETDFCVWCGSRGHSANSCPPPSCQHCQARDHPSARCPTRARCSKCRGLGHNKKECREKLRLAPGEQVECAVCGATDHVENSCESLWRTYHADSSTVLKVQSIAAYCYSCGSPEHFGGDCSESSRSDSIWSLANRDKYVDPESEVVSLSWVPPPPPDEGRPDLGGRSIVPQKHIYFHSDDEEEGEFIQPLVRDRSGQQSHGQIKINTTTTAFSGGETSLPRRPPQPRRGNPPLPSGPPPPLPAQNGRQRAPLRGGGGNRGRGGFSRGRGGGGGGRR